jgi:hypothetical protein
MNLQQTETLLHVAGVLNYLKPTSEKPRTDAFEQAGGTRNPAHEAHTVRVHDMRPVAAHLSLDREGFALIDHSSAVADFGDERQVRGIYYPEAERLVAQVTAAPASSSSITPSGGGWQARRIASLACRASPRTGSTATIPPSRARSGSATSWGRKRTTC